MSEAEKPQQIVLKNARVKYAKLIRPGHAFDEGQPDLWSVNMYLTPEDQDMLTRLGATAKTDKDGADFFVAKRNVRNKKGEDVKPPQMVDGKKQPFAEEVGNGSVCNIAVTPFRWEKGRAGTATYKSGILIYLNAVQVVNHVAANNAADTFTVIDGAPGDASDNGDGLPF